MIKFAEDAEPEAIKDPEAGTGKSRSWKVMIVDDEQSIHDITQVCLKGFVFKGRKISFLDAFSGSQARQMIRENPDTAFIMADVVMETRDSGLKFIRFVREDLKNSLVQIAVRTGQPGLAPESEIISSYRINSYFSKTEVTAQKLVSLVTTSLRTYDLTIRLERALEKRKRAEKQLLKLNQDLEQKVDERTRQLHRANEMKNQFLANMSHEVRTPMNGIMGTATLLLEQRLTRRQQEYAHIIHSSATALLTIVNDILDLSRIEAGRMKFEIRKFDLPLLVEEVAAMFRHGAADKGLDLEVQVHEHTPRYLSGDDTRIKQILINLVGNALKFTQKGWVRIRAFVEKQDPHGIALAFEVEDTGPGISEAFLHRLFDKFSQEDVSFGRKFGGAGLGLAISKELAVRMGGSIEASNKKTGGAVFKVILNLGKPHGRGDDFKDEKKENRVKELRQKVSGLDLNILLADDNPVNQRVFILMLESLNLSARVVDNGRAVLELLEDQSFDMIFMDVQMPELNGLETTRIIRDKASKIRQKDIPIIALTAHAMEENVRACLDAGMDRFLSKPVHPQKIAEAIAGVLGL